MMPSEPSESSFMVTAAAQLEDLKSIVGTLTTAKEGLQRSTRRHRIGMTIQGALLVLLAGVSGVLAHVVVAQHQATVQVCQGGNSYKAADEQHWALFIQIALRGNPDPKAHAAGKLLLDGIAKSDQPRNCGS